MRTELDDINALLEQMRIHHNQRMDNVALSAPPFYKRKIDVMPIIKAVVEGFTEDPGTSDLDNAQPIVVRMLLGDYRRAERLLYELEGTDQKRIDELDRRSGCSDV